MKTGYNVMLLAFLAVWLPSVYSQFVNFTASRRNLTAEDKAYNQFALELLTETSCLLDLKHNVVISPFSVWSVLAIVTEGSSGETNLQLRSALHLDIGSKTLQGRYRVLDSILKTGKGSSIELNSANAVFTDKNRPISKDFESTINKVYHAHIIPVNFHNVSQSVKEINSWVSQTTHNRIKHIANEEDLQDPQLVLANAIYFKGLWKYPFNRSMTKDEDFKDEGGNVLAKVQMMKQSGPFVYGFLSAVESHLVVLPYAGDKFSMVVVLPQKQVPLLQVLERIKLISLGEVYRQLEQLQGLEIDEVRVFLPRFVVKSDFVLNAALANLGIKDAFSTKANFQLINSQKPYISKLIHRAEIEVNEEGTKASGATGAVYVDKMMPALFKADRPFGFFIIENEHNTVLFSGRVINPQST